MGSPMQCMQYPYPGTDMACLNACPIRARNTPWEPWRGAVLRSSGCMGPPPCPLAAAIGVATASSGLLNLVHQPLVSSPPRIVCAPASPVSPPDCSDAHLGSLGGAAGAGAGRWPGGSSLGAGLLLLQQGVCVVGGRLSNVGMFVASAWKMWRGHGAAWGLIWG